MDKKSGLIIGLLLVVLVIVANLMFRDYVSVINKNSMYEIVEETMAEATTSANTTNILLPAPKTDGGIPLMQALMKRKSSRSFSNKLLPEQVLSDLLWAAAGYNRPDEKKRTVPSARNWQEIDVYVALGKGTYRYDPAENMLILVTKGDLRGLTGTQEFVADAPLNLIYVADISKMKGSTPENRDLYMGIDTGFISQNVYLFCASEGLATVVRGMLDREALASAMGLPEHKKVLFAQTVGYPSR